MNRDLLHKVASELQDERLCNSFLERDPTPNFGDSLKEGMDRVVSRAERPEIFSHRRSLPLVGQRFEGQRAASRKGTNKLFLRSIWSHPLRLVR